jgi:carbonic anhydrase
MKKIISGYYQFFDQYFKQQSFYQKLFHQQKPHVMFIACCDSRVDPALLVSAQPGDIFVERNVANVVPHRSDGPNSILIALEVALYGFGVSDIIILGHQRCAGVQMLACNTLHNFGQVPAEYTAREVDLQKKLNKSYNDDTAEEFEKLNLILSCQNLLSHALVSERLQAKKVAVHGWYFSLKTGRLETLCWSCMQFTDLMVVCCGKKVI